MAVYKASMLASKPDAELIANMFTETLYPAPAVSIEEAAGAWRIEVYFADPPDPLALAAMAESFPRFEIIRKLTIEPVVDEDWVAKTQAGLHPVKAGRFFVHGSHDRRRAYGRRHAIEIDAGQAFGTAHHGTTRGCLMIIDRLAKRIKPRRILDIGTGSAVLAIAAAQVFGGRITATDIDPIAIRVEKKTVPEIGSHTVSGQSQRTGSATLPFHVTPASIL
ncbi:MAG: methyltransferase [Rhodomicrobium sp.]|nr:methyltransferase [Rhodomicrobium sp.]